MLQVKDVPKELLDKIKERFEADPRVRELRVQQQMYIRQGKYKAALALAQDIEILYNKCVYEYLEEADKQVEQIDVSDMDMPIEDKEQMMQLLLVCFMCADMLETSIIDMDDVLHRYDKDMHMEMFNDLRDVLRMSKEKLKFLQENSGYMKDLVWADNCDNLYEMAKNKAGAIMRKRKNDPNWGENMKKFIK